MLPAPDSKLVNAQIPFRDLSIGNAYDKVAKLLGIQPHKDGLGYGAALEQTCKELLMETREWITIIDDTEKATNRQLTLVVPSPGQLRFSYAGIYSEFKQFVEKATSEGKGLSEELRAALAHAFQHTAAEQVEAKLVLALERCEILCKGKDKVKDVVISGGVAGNMYLRERSVDRIIFAASIPIDS